MLYRLLVCFSLALLFTGCDVKPDTCKDQSSWTMKIGIYNVQVVNSKRVETKKSVGALSFFQNADSLNFTYIDSMSYSLKYYKKIATIKVKYTRDQIFENYKCGFRTNYIIDTLIYNSTFIDSIKIVQPYITDVYQENCKFYISRDSTKYNP